MTLPGTLRGDPVIAPHQAHFITLESGNPLIIIPLFYALILDFFTQEY